MNIISTDLNSCDVPVLSTGATGFNTEVGNSDDPAQGRRVSRQPAQSEVVRIMSSASTGCPGTDTGSSSSPCPAGPLPFLGNELMGSIANPANMLQAWEHCGRRRNTAPGIDGRSYDKAFALYRENENAIIEKLLNGKYKPMPLRRVYIPKPDGSARPLGIPTFWDRVVQRAIQQWIEPLLDPYFSRFSHGFRIGRNVFGAANQAAQWIADGNEMVVDVDLAKFFDSVPHDLLKQKLSSLTGDSALLQLTNRFLNAGVVENGILAPTIEGVPQGGNLSPLLSNIVLHNLDVFLEANGWPFCRYADDFAVFARSRRMAVRRMLRIQGFLQGLKLKINEKKSGVIPHSKMTYLGFSFPAGRIAISDKNIEKFKFRTEQHLTGTDDSCEQRMIKMFYFQYGWCAHFAQIPDKRQFRDLDRWFREKAVHNLPERGDGLSPRQLALSAWDSTIGRIILIDTDTPSKLSADDTVGEHTAHPSYHADEDALLEWYETQDLIAV